MKELNWKNIFCENVTKNSYLCNKICFYSFIRDSIEKRLEIVYSQSKKDKRFMKKIFRIIMVILNIFAAVALILSCLCCFISPETIWWIGFFGLGFLHLLTANLCFLVFWIFSKRKKLVVISLVPILIGWPFVGRNIQLSDRKIPAKEIDSSIKVLSFNVQGFEQRNTVQSDGKKLNLFDFLREEDAGIICMQEFGPNQWKKDDLKEENIREQLNTTPFYHSEVTREHFGVATFSRYPIVHKEVVYSDNTTNTCICSDLLIGNDTVRVYNVHLKSIGFHHDEKHLLNNVVKKEYGKSDVRVAKSIIRQISVSSFKRARQVEILSSHIVQSPYPVIICGDFNDPPTSHSYQQVRGNRKDAFVKAGSGRSATFHIGHIASLRIDFILYTDVFEAYDYESPRVVLSDHFPVMCRLVKK